MGLTQESTVSQVEVEQEIVELEASHVYVHCYFNNTVKDMLIRIWKTTFLIDKSSSHRSKLVHAENISFAPQWTIIPENKMFQFLLIFEGLPKGCERFDLLEDIPQPGGFYVADILRNKKDVYHVYI
jgi:glutathionylspermidine synthase